MTNLELAKEQGSQAAPNVIDAAKAGEVQIDVTLAQEQGNQAAPLIADSLASSESYDSIKQQGNQAMPLIVDALEGGGSDTGFEILDFTIPNSTTHFPMYIADNSIYELDYYALLRDGYNLPNFTKISVNNIEYDIYPIPEQELPASTTACYLADQEQDPIETQEMIDEIKSTTGVDAKIGDTLVVIIFALLTEQVLSGDVPFILHADQDSWSGTLHADTSVDVFGYLNYNSDSTAYILEVGAYNASNPYYKIGDDGEWTVYDSSNKPEFYLPGNYTIHLKATNNYDESEVTGSYSFQISTSTNISTYSNEDPSEMLACLDFNANIHSSYDSGPNGLNGRNDVVVLYKETSAATWNSAAMTSTSDGYFARVNVGWGHHAIEYKIQVNGVAPDTPFYQEFDIVPQAPSFNISDDYELEDSNGNIGPFVRLHFGANYQNMNTVEVIEYSFDNGETWYDAVHDATFGCELAKVIYEEKTQNGYIPLKYEGLARTKLISDNTVKSQTVDIFLMVLTLIVHRNNEGAGKVNINNIETLLASETEARIGVLYPCDFKAEVIPDTGFVFESCSIQVDGASQQSTDNPSILHMPNTNYASVTFEAILAQSSTD